MLHRWGITATSILTFTIRRHVQAYRKGRITRPVMRRNLLFNLAGLLLTMAAVIYVAGLVGCSGGTGDRKSLGDDGWHHFWLVGGDGDRNSSEFGYALYVGKVDKIETG